MKSITTTFANGKFTLAEAIPSNARLVQYGVPTTTVYQPGDTLPAVSTSVSDLDFIDELKEAMGRPVNRGQITAFFATLGNGPP